MALSLKEEKKSGFPKRICKKKWVQKHSYIHKYREKKHKIAKLKIKGGGMQVFLCSLLGSFKKLIQTKNKTLT